MATLTRPAALRARPDITPYEQHRDYVLAVLARRCGWLDPGDREALFHDAYAVFLEKNASGAIDLDLMRPAQVRAYLTQTSLNKAMDEGKRAGRRRSVSLDDEDTGIEPPDPAKSLDEQLSSRFDDARVREIVTELPERQQLIVKLRFFFNRTPQEIQDYMGVTERVYRRELERATRQLAERFELLRDGTFCESRRSLMLAYVSGIAGPTRTIEARRHLDSCPACRSFVLELRSSARQAAAVMPVPVLALKGPGLMHLLSGGHRWVTERLTGGRVQLMHAAATNADGSRLAAVSAARPGTVALLLAGCIATGSGATYCAVQGIPAPLRSVLGIHTPTRHHAKPVVHRALATQPTVSVPAVEPSHHVVAAAPRPKARTAPAHKPAPSHTAVVKAQAVQTQKATAPEFGVGGGTSEPVQSSSASSGASGEPAPTSAPSSAPPPQPSKPSAEFDP